RALALERITELGDAGAVERLWPLFGAWREGDELALRPKVGETILELAGEEALDPLLQRLPRGLRVALPPDELSGYAASLSGLDASLEERMRAELGSRIWWRRVLAIYYLERV